MQQGYCSAMCDAAEKCSPQRIDMPVRYWLRVARCMSPVGPDELDWPAEQTRVLVWSSLLAAGRCQLLQRLPRHLKRSLA